MTTVRKVRQLLAGLRLPEAALACVAASVLLTGVVSPGSGPSGSAMAGVSVMAAKLLPSATDNSRVESQPGLAAGDALTRADRPGRRVVVIAMDNTHLSDVLQMPALAAMLHRGTLLADDHTGLVSFTHPDYTTIGSGDYPSRTGIISQSQLDGGHAVTFSYWKDLLPGGQPTHLGPPPWRAWTAHGMAVGAVGWADWELESSSELARNHVAVAPGISPSNYLGYAVHYPGGRTVFGLPNLPSVSSARLLGDPGSEVGTFSGGWDSNFGPDRSLTSAAALLTHGVPVVYDYIRSVHSAPGGGTLVPGTAAYGANLSHYDTAFGDFFAALAKAGINRSNTDFVFTTDEGDHFSPGGELGASLPALMGKAGMDTSGLTVTGSSAAMLYAKAGAAISLAGLTAVPGWHYLASGPALRAIHVQTADPALYDPAAILFSEPSWYYGSSGAQTSITADPNYLWNHGTVSAGINTIWAGFAGPGVRSGSVTREWTDSADVLPTLEQVVFGTARPGLSGLAIPSVLSTTPPHSAPSLPALVSDLKRLDAPVGPFGVASLQVSSTAAIDPQAAPALDSSLASLVDQRDAEVATIHHLLRLAIAGQAVAPRALARAARSMASVQHRMAMLQMQAVIR